MITISVLNDDRCHNKVFAYEHGLSFYLKIGDKAYLFDFGESAAFLDNAAKLGIDTNELACVFLSHGDYDHGGGLNYLNSKYKLVCHPSCFEKRYSKRTGKDGGLSYEKDYYLNKFNLLESKDFLKIDDKLFYSGEIPRLNDFEGLNNLPMLDVNGKTYLHFDDSALFIKENDSLVIVSGCAHSGICNTIEYAMKMTDCHNIKAVVGGFHLKNIDEQTIQTMEYLKSLDCDCYLSHCTSDEVCAYLKKELKNVSILAVSDVIKL